MAEPTSVTLEELVALLKARGVMSEPGEPAQPVVHGELALLRHAKDALEAHTQDLEAKVRELESALHAANVATRTLHGTNVSGRTSTIELETQFEAERTLVAELSRQVDALRLDAGNAARARIAERKGFELQIEQLQKHLRERRTDLAAASGTIRGQGLVIEQLQGQLKQSLDAEGNAADAKRVQEQQAGQIQRQRDLINTLQDERAELARKLEAVTYARDRLEEEKAELARALDFEVTNRAAGPNSVGAALLYAATATHWAGQALTAATQGKQRYATNAFDRAVEANMWFVKATTKDED